MRPYRSGEGPLDGMIELLVENSQAPPKEVKGVSQGFLDGGLGFYSAGEGWTIVPTVLACFFYSFEGGTLRLFSHACVRMAFKRFPMADRP